MQEKRGLSQVVTTLIIILLVLVAVGIVWVVVRNIVQEGSEQIELGQFTVDLEIKRVQVQGNDITIIVVRRNVGEGEVAGLNFVFSDGQNSEIITVNESLAELEEKSFTLTLTQLNTSSLESVAIAPIFKDDSGEGTIGNVVDTMEISEEVKAGISGAYGGAFEELGFIGTGRYEATISSNPGIYPEFKSLVVDPLDVLPGDNQTFTATVYSPHNVTNVTTETQLDTEILFLPLEKISDDGAGTSTWSASWIVYDTHIETYRTNFTATDSIGNMDYASLTWTDAECGFTHGSDSDLLSSCVVTALSGADNSGITVSSGVTMTLNSGGTVAYAPGYSVSKSGTGKIAFSGGVIKKGYLFYTDADGDLYGGDSLVYDTGSTKSGHIRASNTSLLGTDDCNDNDGDIYQTIAATVRTDADQDRYDIGGLGSGNTCLGDKSSFWYKDSTGAFQKITEADRLGTDDCYDSNANANPGQTSYFDTHRGDNSYDYDCDSSETKQWTDVNAVCETCESVTAPCTLINEGSTGWTAASSPACGASATYISDEGTCTADEFNDCVVDPSCNSGSRTQKCR